MNNNLEIAIKASLDAGEAIMKIYNSVFNVEYKTDKSPLTEADQESNQIINKYLTNTKIPIISEENQQIEYAIRSQWKQFWMVDPLDGTKEFINKNGEFTVNIALIEKQKPILGVIYVPVTKTLYFGNTVNKQAYKAILNSYSADLKIVKEKSKLIHPIIPNNKIKVTASRSHLNQETSTFLDQLREKHKNVEIINKGSSLKFCDIAEGNANIYPRFFPTMEWDTAAGHAICNAVGVRVISQESQKELLYNKKALINPSFLVKSIELI